MTGTIVRNRTIVNKYITITHPKRGWIHDKSGLPGCPRAASEVEIFLPGVHFDIGGGIVQEVATYQAKPVDVEWKRVIDNPEISRSDFIKYTLSEYLDQQQLQSLAKNPPRTGLWKSYLGKFSWNISVTGSATPLHIWLRTFNGERKYYDYATNPPQLEQRSTPKHLKITWENSRGKRYLAEIALEEQEIYQAFRKISKTDPEQTIELQIELGEQAKSISISVRSDRFILELVKAKIEVFSLPE